MRETYKLISGGMCDFREYYDTIAQWLPDDCKVVEVGVADGFSSIYLAEALENMGKKYELVMVDSMQYGGPHQLKEILNNVQRANLSGVRIEPKDSLNASCMFPDGWADFVFIDASHEYEPTKADIRLWYRKVKDGGRLAGHDFSCPAVKQAVLEVIPDDILNSYETEKGYGVWDCPKVNGKNLC